MNGLHRDELLRIFASFAVPMSRRVPNRQKNRAEVEAGENPPTDAVATSMEGIVAETHIIKRNHPQPASPSIEHLEIACKRIKLMNGSTMDCGESATATTKRTLDVVSAG